jgi:hypothetical protein
MARRIATFIVFLVVLTVGAMVNAQVAVELNGIEVSFPDQQPIIIDGRTLVPVRFVSEALGAVVEWHEQTSRVTVALADKVIALSLGSRMVTVDNAQLFLDVSAQAVGGRTMVPLRFVSEMLGAKVHWDQSRNRVVILSAQTEVGNQGDFVDADDAVDVSDSVVWAERYDLPIANNYINVQTIRVGETWLADRYKFLYSSTESYVSNDSDIITVNGSQITGLQSGATLVRVMPTGRVRYIGQPTEIMVVYEEPSEVALLSKEVRLAGGDFFRVEVDGSNSVKVSGRNTNSTVKAVALMLGSSSQSEQGGIVTTTTSFDRLGTSLLAADGNFMFTLALRETPGASDYFISPYWGAALYGQYTSNGVKIEINIDQQGASLSHSELYYSNKAVQMLNLDNFYSTTHSGNAELTALAAEITKGVSGDYAKAKALSEWVARNIYYDYDLLAGVAVRTVDALGVYKLKRSVCEGYANLLHELLVMNGLKARKVSGNANQSPMPLRDMDKHGAHAWNEVFVDGRWVIVDSTWMSPNTYRAGVFETGTGVRSLYFDMSLESFSNTHKIKYYER